MASNDDGIGCFTVLIIFCVFIFWLDFPNRWSDKAYMYPLICSKEYKNDKCTSFELTANKITYRINEARAEVVILTKEGSPPTALTNCSILDKENWECSYADGFGKIFLVDGIRQNQDTQQRFRFVSQWRYRFGQIFSFILRAGLYFKGGKDSKK